MVIDRTYMDSLHDLALFRLAKRILSGEIEYPVSPVELDYYPALGNEDAVCRLWNFANCRDLRPIEVVDPVDIPSHTCATAGFFALSSGYGVRMAILNCDEIAAEVFEESQVRGCLLGPRVSKISRDVLPYCPRYMHVDKRNPYFSADSNVLYSKKGDILYRYAPGKPETEFRVPPTVRMLGNCSFMMAYNLQKLYLPRRMRMSNPDPGLDWAYIPPAVQVVYYDP